MAQYLLSVHMTTGEEPPEAEAMERAYADVDALNHELRDEGIWVFAGGLQPPDTAAVVRAQDGELTTTDGSFSHSNVQLGGFWVIDVPNREAALAWASKATRACQQPVEVRPFQAEPVED